MNKYLIQISYTSEAWAAMLKEPQNRLEKVKTAVQNLKGQILEGYFALDDCTLIVIFEFPDNETAAAASMAFLSGGAIKDLKLTPLISPEDAMKAMAKGASIGYKPVTAK